MPTPFDPLRTALARVTMGAYEILAELGQGGMAVVYLAHDIPLDRKVAIKVMAPRLMGVPGMAARFLQEARIAAGLSHPHIIPIYAVRQHETVLYFAMQYVEGRPLDAVLAEGGPLPCPAARALLAQVGGALAHAHRRGVVHRDVKPSNVLVDLEGRAMVTDFGIAKPAAGQPITLTGAAIGTPAYMSPEQCRGEEATAAADQYALGAVLYELFAGRPPFHAAEPLAQMYAHVHEAPRPVGELRPDCPPALAAAVMRMLAKDPAARWPSLAEAVAAAGAAGGAGAGGAGAGGGGAGAGAGGGAGAGAGGAGAGGAGGAGAGAGGGAGAGAGAGGAGGAGAGAGAGGAGAGAGAGAGSAGAGGAGASGSSGSAAGDAGASAGSSAGGTDIVAEHHALEAALEAFVDSPVATRVAPGVNATTTVRVLRSFRLHGLPCREYLQTVIIDGIPVNANGTLCQQPDGSWKLR